jgi:pyrroloquinoline-quinone synthase
MQTSSGPPWSREEFEQRLRALGARYHIHHPYQVKMNAGELNREQIQGWVANRFYYQINIPQKDAALMANCPDRDVRRHWIQRILDHDGRAGEDGGIEAWIRCCRACASRWTRTSTSCAARAGTKGCARR